MTLQMHVAEAPRGELAAARHKHYFLERPCQILIIGERLKAKTKYRGLLRHISVGGALVDFNPAIALPQNFFLQIDGFAEEIGCTQIHRRGPELGARFNILLTPATLSRLIRVNFSSCSI